MGKSDAWPPFAFTQDSAWGKCYLAFLRGKLERSGSHHTLEHYRHDLTLFLTSPALMPDQYTRAHVEDFIHSPGQALGRVGRPPGPGTINNRLSVLNAFYQYAGSYGIQNGNGILEPLMNRMSPTAGLHHLQRSQPPFRSLSSEELHRFFAAIGTGDLRATRDRAIFLLLFWCARRRQEIVSLRFRDIETGIIIDGTQRREAILFHFRGKGHSRQDDVQEMPPAAATALFEYLKQSGKIDTIQPDDPIFSTLPDYIGRFGYDPQRPLAPVTIWHMAKRYAARAGLDPRRVTTHSFRHSAARARYEGGEGLREIQRLLRHRNLSTTSDYLQALTGAADNGYKLIQSTFDDL